LPLMRGEDPSWRPYIQIECGGTFECLTDGKEKFVWFTRDGREQFFDLRADPMEERNLIDSPDHAERVDWWRARLGEELQDRPEGFSDGRQLCVR